MSHLKGLFIIFCVVIIMALPFDLLKFAIVQYFSPLCVEPESFSDNAGALVVVDSRAVGRATTFVEVEAAEWMETQLENIDSLRDTRDVFVYVHGFRTSMDSATCVGKALRPDLADLAESKDGVAPDVLVFGWPGELEGWRFSTAQTQATQAAGYLAALITALDDRRIVLVAHSLGAQVAMEAADMIPAGPNNYVLRAIVLVQGAIQAPSIRTWTYEMDMRFPAIEARDRREGRPHQDFYAEKDEGTGCYVRAARKARHMIVTNSSDDITLSRMFPTDELWVPSRCRWPPVLPMEGASARTLPQVTAIGTPMRREMTLYAYKEPLSDASADPYRDPFDLSNDMSTLEPAAKEEVLWERTEVYRFTVPHPNYYEISLDSLSGWRPFFDWHSPLNSSAMRRDIITKILAILASATEPDEAFMYEPPNG